MHTQVRVKFVGVFGGIKVAHVGWVAGDIVEWVWCFGTFAAFREGKQMVIDLVIFRWGALIFRARFASFECWLDTFLFSCGSNGLCCVGKSGKKNGVGSVCGRL